MPTTVIDLGGSGDSQQPTVNPEHAGSGEEKVPMDPTIEKMSDQSFVDGRERLRLIGEEAARGGQMLSERAREQFVHTAALVGAAAAGRLDRDMLAHQILQQNAAAGQPANAPKAG